MNFPWKNLTFLTAGAFLAFSALLEFDGAVAPMFRVGQLFGLMGMTLAAGYVGGWWQARQTEARG
jgi:hypothetical protein